MPLTWDDLLVNLDGIDSEALLSSWQWKLKDQYQIVLISAAGDLLLADQQMKIHLLDVGQGTLSQIADSPEELKQLMVQPDQANEWLVTGLVSDMKNHGHNLGPNQCYSFKVLPVLGGEYELSNFEVTDLYVHFDLAGQIHQKIKDLPDGTAIGNFQIQ